MPESNMIFTRKINKIQEFHMIFAQNAQILHDNCPKNISPNFEGARALLPLSPTPMLTDNVL